jgi:hypothetical protein
VRSFITALAAAASFHRLASPDRAFSSSSFFTEASQSKMPPQQFKRLLDFSDEGLGFGPHEALHKNGA